MIRDYLKSRFPGKTTEQLFGIPEQPAPQCQHIDRLKELVREIDAGRDNPVLKEVLKDLEDLRSNIVQLRAWGQGCKSKLFEVLNHNDNLLTAHLDDAHKSLNYG